MFDAHVKQHEQVLANIAKEMQAMAAMQKQVK